MDIITKLIAKIKTDNSIQLKNTLIYHIPDAVMYNITEQKKIQIEALLAITDSPIVYLGFVWPQTAEVLSYWVGVYSEFRFRKRFLKISILGLPIQEWSNAEICVCVYLQDKFSNKCDISKFF